MSKCTPPNHLQAQMANFAILRKVHPYRADVKVTLQNIDDVDISIWKVSKIDSKSVPEALGTGLDTMLAPKIAPSPKTTP